MAIGLVVLVLLGIVFIGAIIAALVAWSRDRD